MDESKKRLPLLALVAVILLMNIVIFKNFIFKNYLYLYQDIGNDTINIYYPYYYSFIKAFKSGELSFWFNNLGMGNNILSMGILLTDPFFLILLAFGEKYLVYGLLVKAIVSSICAGVLFYIYEGNFSLSQRSKIVGAILYAFNGYIILWGQHYHFATIVVLVPLLMHAYEILLKKEKGILLVISVFLIAFYSVYFLYMASLFLFIYAAVRYIDCGEKNIKAFLRHFLKSILCYLLGLGLSGLLLMPSLWVMLSSPRVNADISSVSFFSLNSIKYYITTILRTFSYNSMGPGDFYFGFMNYYESPVLYSGILTLLMLPFFFKAVVKRKRKIYAGMLFLFIIFLALPYFSAMFNAFSITAYRWTFMVNFLMIIGAVKGFDYYENNRNFKVVLFIGASICVVLAATMAVGMVFLPDLVKSKNISFIFLSRSLFFLFSYIVILKLYDIKSLKKYAKVALIVALACELMLSSYMAVFRNRVVENKAHFNDRIGYNDYTKEALDFIKSQDSGVYRIEKNYFSQFFNANLVQGYYGIKAYNSLNQNSTLGFLKKMDVPFYINQSYIKDFANRRNLEQLAGIKYYLMRGKQDPPKGYTFLYKANDVSVYKNDNYLPLGFSYDKCISESDFLNLSKEEKDRVILKAFVVRDVKEVYGINEIEKQTISDDNYANDISERKKEELQLRKFKNGHIKGDIEIKDKDKVLFVSVPYDEGWVAKVDGRKQKVIKANLGFMAVNISKGNHTVEFDYEQPFLKPGVIASIISLILIVIFSYRKVI